MKTAVMKEATEEDPTTDNKRTNKTKTKENMKKTKQKKGKGETEKERRNNNTKEYRHTSRKRSKSPNSHRFQYPAIRVIYTKRMKNVMPLLKNEASSLHTI